MGRIIFELYGAIARRHRHHRHVYQHHLRRRSRRMGDGRRLSVDAGCAAVRFHRREALSRRQSGWGHHASGRRSASALGIGLVASLFYVSRLGALYVADRRDLHQPTIPTRASKICAPARANRRRDRGTFRPRWGRWRTQYANPLFRMALPTLTEIFPVALLVSIVSAALLRRKQLHAGGAAARLRSSGQKAGTRPVFFPSSLLAAMGAA